MACQQRKEVFKQVFAKVRDALKKEGVSHSEAVSRAKVAADQIIDKAQSLSAAKITKKVTTTAQANAVTTEPAAKLPSATIPKDLFAMHEEYRKNPTPELSKAIKTAEMAIGFRNNKGELLVAMAPRTNVGSSDTDPDTEITDDEFSELYENTDGTMSKAARVNETLIALDKKNKGDNFNQEHSDYLTSTLNTIINTVRDLQESGVKISKGVLEKLEQDNQGAYGHYNPNTGNIELNTDTQGPGAEFRTKFSMTNQEVYVHELTHAAMDFLFDENNAELTKNPDVIAMTANLKEVYAKAMKESTWKTLLPEGNYTKYEEAQAKEKWDYVFANKKGHGLHEFMAGIMTNQMFREGMESIPALNTEKVKGGETTIEKLRKMFSNLLEKIFGYAVNKRDNSITKEGARLITAIMRANHNSVENTAWQRAIKTANESIEKVQGNIDVAEASVKKLTDPFIGALDSVKSSIKNDSQLLDKETITAMKKLVTEIEGLLKDTYNPSSNKSRLVQILQSTFKAAKALTQFVRAMPKIYKLRQLTAGTKRSREVSAKFAKTMNDLLTSIGLYEDGMVRGIARDFMDNPGIYNMLADTILKLTHSVDGMRQNAYEGVLQDLKEGFDSVNINNDTLNLKHNEALTEVVLRTDIQSLDVDAEGLLELLSNPAEVKAKIAELKKGLTKEQVLDAKSLASYMVTGQGTASNAENISSSFGQEKATESTPEIVKQIDQLVSYMALDITNADTKENLRAFIAGETYTEYSGTLWSKAKKAAGIIEKAGNEEKYKEDVLKGVNTFIDRAKGLQEASKQELRANPHNRIKGYVKETYNTDYTLEFHPMEDKERLEREGYKFIRESKKLRGSTTTYGMFISNRPEIKRANGALGLQDKKSRGFTLNDVIARESAESDAQWDAAKRRKAFEALFNSTLEDYRKDPSSVDMQPMYNDKGQIVNFRTTMSIADKKEFLDMETRGTQNLARSYSTMGTAAATAKNNRDVVDMLFKDYQDNYNDSSADRYVTIEPKSLNAGDYGVIATSMDKKEALEMERFWARLPSDTKAYARKKFGSNKIVIRKELLTIAFGEDNYSLTEAKLLKGLSPRNKAILAKMEGIWQDMMQIAKSNIVIKTPEVLFGNLVSNFKILLYLGVNPVHGTKLMVAGARDLKRYENNRRELGSLKRDKLGGKPVNEARIKELEDELDTNSVAPLLDAGLYQSIVEDVNTAGELNRTATWFDEKVDKYVTNETANTAIQYLFLTQKTKPYQQLLKATQVSDFYFRYAQYYDAINNKGHSKERAMRDAIDNYINYEVPLEKHIRYGDAMGTWFFVKYFVKAQRVIKKIAKEHPLRMGADILLQQFITGDTADIQDSSILDKGLRTYNPFKLPDRIMEVIYPAGLELPMKGI